ncbi:uncharacterized protein BDR25DRAFT_356657 [Lindgomyces ingoldianus]|uniref:Uncharacterized protein n=1 Tax=Lindgomyces ingoldianus TaxID=673940 RepID=A0ACB6QR05_9PLEO|nr:uncharacterized protein BDR25DRAFT_356657 [Lindgomyces ingoldianus]KAF2469424.1 hypothetical protein BDR25DRAFT_356657 [Lindgomyces ingoldianus]
MALTCDGYIYYSVRKINCWLIIRTFGCIGAVDVRTEHVTVTVHFVQTVVRPVGSPGLYTKTNSRVLPNSLSKHISSIQALVTYHVEYAEASLNLIFMQSYYHSSLTSHSSSSCSDALRRIRIRRCIALVQPSPVQLPDKPLPKPNDPQYHSNFPLVFPSHLRIIGLYKGFDQRDSTRGEHAKNHVNRKSSKGLLEPHFQQSLMDMSIKLFCQYSFYPPYMADFAPLDVPCYVDDEERNTINHHTSAQHMQVLHDTISRVSYYRIASSQEGKDRMIFSDAISLPAAMIRWEDPGPWAKPSPRNIKMQSIDPLVWAYMGVIAKCGEMWAVAEWRRRSTISREIFASYRAGF